MDPDPIRHLLVALDLDERGQLSPGSLLAADQARRVAARLSARLTLFHSTAEDETWDAGTQGYVHSQPGLSAAGRSALEAVQGEFQGAGLQADLVLDEDTAWLGIVRRVLQERIDLVISGKRNESDRRDHRIGSVSMKLLRKCPCPVWVVKPGSDPVPQRILAATDLTPVGERVLEYAALLSEHFGAALHVVHAFQLPLAIQLEGEESVANFDRLQRQERRGKLEQQIAEAKITREVSYHIGRTSPTHGIMECYERLHPDLVVMGTVSRGGVAGLLVGNTAERLLARLDCSLFTVKPGDFVCPVQAEPHDQSDSR